MFFWGFILDDFYFLTTKFLYLKYIYMEIVLRPYRIAKDRSCKFYCGSEHHPTDFNMVKNFERAIENLGLEEKDKWIVCK